MTASVLQETFFVGTGASLSTLSATFASACTPGSVIHSGLVLNGSNRITSQSAVPTDGTNTYTALDAAQATNYGVKHWLAPNSSSSALTVSIVLSAGANTQYLFWIREIGGVSQTVDAHNASFNNSGTGGANSITVSATAANQPNFSSAFGWAYDTATAVGTTLPWVQGQLNMNPPVMGGRGTTEHLRTTGTGSITATFGDNSSAITELACIAIFDETVSGSSGGLLLAGVG